MKNPEVSRGGESLMYLVPVEGQDMACLSEVLAAVQTYWLIRTDMLVTALG